MIKTAWHYIKWPLIVLVVLYFGLVIYRIPAVGEKERTAEAVAYIQAQKINLATVEGTSLPPQPYKPENDATVAGIDANVNNIRDDVELAIFAKYPNDPKIRAAQLQYALTEQMYLTQVFNTETWKAVAEQDSRAFSCATKILSSEQIKEVEDLVNNIELRTQARTKAFEFITSHGDAPGASCDIDLATL